MFLDAYYLALERCFRQQYERIVQKLAAGKLYSEDLYRISPCSSLFWETGRALGSFSVWGFYGVLLGGIGVIWMGVP
ncbi:MAG: hypothetical protein N2170_07590 [Bacteroidia bacterium]|nr:hypothetical protein [Bacteroidia bacterium]